jgi:hypothetical protein
MRMTSSALIQASSSLATRRFDPHCRPNTPDAPDSWTWDEPSEFGYDAHIEPAVVFKQRRIRAMVGSRIGRAIVFSMTVGIAATSAIGDEGMWLFSRPPTKVLKDKYNFTATPQWLEHVQKSCVRFNSGGSGSIISPDGLVMTNHHVGSDQIQNLSTAENDLLKNGFYARTRDQELKCDDLELNILWSTRDVTKDVEAAVSKNMSTADAATARRKKIAQIEKESQENLGLKSEVVTLYHGARYHLYLYKRYADVRLVMAPEQQAAFFGGDTDNFEYPRFNLDMCFFRIYENGKPLKAEHYLRWNEAGANEGDLTFIIGHPGRTQRLFTVDHLEFLRDVSFPTLLKRAWRRECQLNTFAGRSEENARIATGDLHGIENARKAWTGIIAGLQDPAIMKAKQDAETRLRSSVDANAEYKSKWAGAWDQIAAAEQTYASFFERHTALETRRAVLGGDLFRIARHLHRLADEKNKPNAERLPEYQDANLESLNQQLFAATPIYDNLEIDKLASGLAYLVENFGGSDPFVVRILAGQSPRARAEAAVRGTSLKDVAARKKIADGGTQAIADSKDPMILLAKAVDGEARALRKRFEDEVESVERESYARIAAAQFAINGEDMYPDATFTLRLSFGPIRGFRDGKTDVPAFTDFSGLYERLEQRKAAPPFDLPQRWVDGRGKIDLKTPYNFICTADIIGGNSGSPVINKDGKVIGLVFDGNIHGLIWDIAYTDEKARAVCVDARAIIEAMRKLYDAGTLADEIIEASKKQISRM